MLAIAGQTAGSNWRTFSREPMGTLWETEANQKKSSKINFFSRFDFFLISAC